MPSSMITKIENWTYSMKTMFALIILYFFVTACSSSDVISSDSSSNKSSIIKFNEFAKGKDAQIMIGDKVVSNATNVYLSADSLFWTDSESTLGSSVVKSDVKKVIFINNWVGGLEGWGLGLLSGGIAGLLTYWAVGKGNVWAFVGLTVIGVSVGALAGITTGLFIGHKYEYEFDNNNK
jgi:hypothetical protein